LKAFHKVTEDKSEVHDVWIKPYHKPATSHVHQFIFFFKPEATNTRGGANLELVLNKSLALLEKGIDGKGIKIGGIRVLGGPYLDKHNIMVQHYGVIAKISREGESAISEAARQALKTKYAEDIAGWSPEHYKSHILGGHQFLAKFPEFNAFSLLAINDNMGTFRLGPGTYSLKLKIKGELFIILNPFHAYQVVPYNAPGNAIVAFECLSEIPWTKLRNNIGGPTDPTTAPEGSIRHLLLKEKDHFGLHEVDRGNNGVHMSAGPLEGMIEVQRFFSDHTPLSFDDTAFGHALKDKGVDISKVVANPDVDTGKKKESLFDITEEKDSSEALDILSHLKL
jgi:hypothetical protein